MPKYIEVEPILEEMQNLIENASYNYPYASIAELEALRARYEAVIEYIKEQPIADVQPEKRGKWILVSQYRDEEGYINDIFRCSVCEIPNGETTAYCPHCGAKMGEQHGD